MGKEAGGTALKAYKVENYPGFQSIQGFELMQKFQRQVRALGAEIETQEAITARKKGGEFVVSTANGGECRANSLILAMGTKVKKLSIPGEEEFLGKGVSYCATCDAPLFAGRKVAVIGGGNSAFEAVIDLLPIATEIFLIDIAPHWLADQILIDQIEE